MDETKGELTKVVTVQITTIHKIAGNDLRDMMEDEIDTQAYEQCIKFALCADDVKVIEKQYFPMGEKKREA